MPYIQSTLTNIYASDHVDFWIKPYYDGNTDVDFVKCSAEHVGTPPEWFVNILKEYDLAGIIGAHNWTKQYTDPATQMTYSCGTMSWCLERGITVKQPFCIRIFEPTYTTDYYGEVDEDIKYELLCIKPVSNSLDKLQHLLKQIKSTAAASSISRLAQINKTHSDISGWEIRLIEYGEYWNSKSAATLRYYKADENKHYHISELLREEADSFQEAKTKLIKRISLKYPEVSEKQINNLPVRYS